MYRIKKKFGPFAAAHFLTTVPAGHQCGRLHGHNYEVEVELVSLRLDDQGFVVDYGALSPFNDYLVANMDHRNLNEQFSFPTTAEHLARHLCMWILEHTDWPVIAVSVSETPGKTSSTFEPHH